MKTYVLFNPIAGHGRSNYEAEVLAKKFLTDTEACLNITEVDYVSLIKQLTEEDKLILCGGDGTLNRFADAVRDIDIKADILYSAMGSGNDFMHDIGKPVDGEPVRINKYLKNLPIVTVGGKEYPVLNGVGYGIDGYCCEIGDMLREKSDKPVNYAGIAIKGLLFHFKPRNATVTVDGVEHKFTKVWLAATMHGRYYGGGMVMAPNQVRNNEDGTVSLVVMHDSGKLQTLMIFPSIFKGEHTKHTKYVTVLTGKQITVSFDSPTPLQIDGETVLGVESYTVKSALGVKAQAAAEVTE